MGDEPSLMKMMWAPLEMVLPNALKRDPGADADTDTKRTKQANSYRVRLRKMRKKKALKATAKQGAQDKRFRTDVPL